MSSPRAVQRPVARPSRGLEPRRVDVMFVSIVLGAALVGGAVALGLAGAMGAFHHSSHSTTVVEQTPPATMPAPSLTSPWSVVYAQTAPGTVELTVQMASTFPTPFGEREERATAEGSGLVLDGRGDILTAAHVVTSATSITVTFPNGSKRGATVLGEDNSTDTAVVHVNPAGLTLRPLRLGSSRSLAVGDPLAVIGNALGFEGSMSIGIVSGLDRTIEAPNGFTIAHAIQTDAAMNPGNSGGPLLSSRGEVIGIADQIATGTNQFGRTASETSTGVGFAVPIDLITPELSPLEHGQTVTHAYLGVETAPSASGQAGALIESVVAGSPAGRAGLRAGDLIVGVNGKAISNAGDLIAATTEAHRGQHLELAVLRGGRRVIVAVTLATEPAHAPSP